ncbi:7459_t:CDS:1 [Ambispora gerdemannii]|uniref:7459_t:CDS:1 n=1 Tax=Ambispora gerdemannii TaxID=144530 RepID=A0A9N8YUJ9_9GLOM|nr:7459_t:CDS:1 [Ambispora gerdemannii]
MDSFTFIVECGDTTTISNEDFTNHPCDLHLSVDELIASVNNENATNSHGEPPRPNNSFLLFRRNFTAGIVGITRDQNFIAEVSILAAKAWKEATPRVKQFFGAMAEKAKTEHKRRFPGYRFNPKRQIRKRSPKKVSSKKVVVQQEEQHQSFSIDQHSDQFFIFDQSDEIFTQSVDQNFP